MTTPFEQPVSPTWRQHFVALFLTFHLICIALYTLPRPPSVDDAVLNHPEVKAEVESGMEAIPAWARWRDTNEDMLADLFSFVRSYSRVTARIRHRVSPYVTAIGSTQSWHMFGGTPPRFPLVLEIDIWPKDADGFERFQDLNWGTPDSKAMNFRHRKVHENLAAWEREGNAMWVAYAVYWACRWDALHPDNPALRVRLSFTRLTTPTVSQVRRGETDRNPRRGITSFEWVRP